MATFCKRGSSWRVELTVNGVRRSGTFSTRKEGKLWADDMRSEMKRMAAAGIPDRVFRELLQRLPAYSSPRKRGAPREKNMVAVFMRDPIAKIPLARLSASDFSAWRERRLRFVSSATVRREMTVLSHAATSRCVNGNG